MLGEIFGRSAGLTSVEPALLFRFFIALPVLLSAFFAAALLNVGDVSALVEGLDFAGDASPAD